MIDMFKISVLAIFIAVISACTLNQEIAQATIDNFQFDSDSGTQTAHLMCFKRHIAPYTESSRSIKPDVHKIYVRAVDYSYMNPGLRTRTQWGGIIRTGTYVLLEAQLNPAQQVQIMRADKDGQVFIWLQDTLSNTPVSDVVSSTMVSRFNIDNILLERVCAKGTI